VWIVPRYPKLRQNGQENIGLRPVFARIMSFAI
jgi:hypothetical protein